MVMKIETKRQRIKLCLLWSNSSHPY